MSRQGRVRFVPKGDLSLISAVKGKRPNPIAESGLYDTTWAARLFVGFSIEEKIVYTIDDLVMLVRDYLKRVRIKGHSDFRMPEDSSFLLQRGVYTHAVSGKVNEETSAQIVIINLGVSILEFKAVVLGLAEHICDKWRQESVIVEIQKNGVVQKTWFVVGKRTAVEMEKRDPGIKWIKLDRL